jgi:hypothetical protein
VDGRPVVDLWGGLADGGANRPWDEDTITSVASTAKGATAICAHMPAQRGELDPDAPVMKYRPEFGAAGKERIPVRWLLSHQAGLPVVDGPLTFQDACAWHPVIRALGFLVGEVVGRIAGGRMGRPALGRLMAGLLGPEEFLLLDARGLRFCGPVGILGRDRRDIGRRPAAAHRRVGGTGEDSD